MDKDEILQKSREENAAAFMDERERNLRLREDSFALGCGLLLALALACSLLTLPASAAGPGAVSCQGCPRPACCGPPGPDYGHERRRVPLPVCEKPEEIRYFLGVPLHPAGFVLPLPVFYESGVMDDKLILKNRLKDARTERGLSQSALAELVGVSRNTISSIETGQFNPTAKLALVLCIALDKKFEELFYF